MIGDLSPMIVPDWSSAKPNILPLKECFPTAPRAKYKVSQKKSPLELIYNWSKIKKVLKKIKQNMTPFPNLKKAIQEAGVNPGIQEISEEIINEF